LNGGDYRATLVCTSNDPAQPEVHVPVGLHVTGVPVLSLESDTLDFGEVYIGYPVTRELAITNSGTDLLQVSTIESNLGDVAVDLSGFTLVPGGDTSLALTLTPVAVGPVEGTLTLRSNDSVAAVQILTLRAVVALPPTFAFSPDSIAFVLPRGDTQTVPVTIANGGPGILKWSVPDSIGVAPFSVSPASGTLAPGTAQDATLIVRSALLPAGTYQSTVTFTHNDPANPPSAIALYLDLFDVRQGDANADRIIDSRDIIYLVRTLWGAGPDPYGTSGDLNCDGAVTLTDIVMLINYVFKGGAAPDC